LPDQLARGMPFKVTHYITHFVLLRKPGYKMDVVRHDHKYKQVHPLSGTEKVKTIDKNAFGRIAIE
jgi:hypothetical protein